MAEVVLELTKEQRIAMAKEMGVVCDELMVSLLPKDCEDMKISEFGEGLLIVMGKTLKIS